MRTIKRFIFWESEIPRSSQYGEAIACIILDEEKHLTSGEIALHSIDIVKSFADVRLDDITSIQLPENCMYGKRFAVVWKPKSGLKGGDHPGWAQKISSKVADECPLCHRSKLKAMFCTNFLKLAET